jgi:rhodanese-related sulfurtransferase
MGVTEITAEELSEKRNANEELRIIDVRTQAEFARGHLPGAENIPISQLSAEASARNRDGAIVVICTSGNRSLRAARHLSTHEGIDSVTSIASVDGGYRDWEYELVVGGTNSERKPSA